MNSEMPIMRYFGGKWRLAPWIISHFPAHKCYAEPYCGAASVLMKKERSHTEVINDVNGRMVSLFQVLRDPQKSEQLKKMLELTPYSKGEYHIARDKADHAVQDACRVLVLGWQSFGGISPNGKNMGWRRQTVKRWLDVKTAVSQWTRRLQGVYIDDMDAIDLIKQWDEPDTLFYCDPPYLMETRKDERNIYKVEMSESDHEDFLQVITSISGMAIISGYESDLYRDALKDWTPATKTSQDLTSDPRDEWIWISPAAIEHLDQGMLW